MNFLNNKIQLSSIHTGKHIKDEYIQSTLSTKPSKIPSNISFASLDSCDYKQAYIYSLNKTSFEIIQVFDRYKNEHFPLPLKRCAERKYPKDLPTISVVLIYLNEALSIIKRAIRSIIDKTPAHLLKEIILVDDSSSNGRLTPIERVCYSISGDFPLKCFIIRIW